MHLLHNNLLGIKAIPLATQGNHFTSNKLAYKYFKTFQPLIEAKNSF